MNLIAYGLALHHPAAYALIFMLLYPPVMVIIFGVVDWIKRRWKR